MSERPQHDPTRARMSDLCESFPMLRGRRGVRPFDPEALDAMAVSGEGTSGLRHAVRFVLSVWNGANERGKCRVKGMRTSLMTWWRVGPFDLVEAWSAWDDDHRRACMAWLRKPFWP